MNKKELEEHNKALRAKVDELQAQVDSFQEQEKVLGEMDEQSVGAFFDEEKRMWNLVTVDYNKETGEAKVNNIESVNADFAMLDYRIKKFVAENINLKNLRR